MEDRTMPSRDSIMWVVSCGSSKTYFYDEGEAREYARDRYDYDLDGVPFIGNTTLHEAITELNRLSNLDHRVSFEVMP
jgi:uncharacterized membrane-anchored protein